MADLFRQVLEVFDRLGLWDDGVELIGSWSFLLYQRQIVIADTGPLNYLVLVEIR